MSQSPLSTFSIDTDTASYSNVRRWLKGGDLPPPSAVRTEEMINYFSYDYPAASGDRPFSAHVEVAACPWKEGHRLVRIGLRGRRVSRSDRKPANLVFLVDVSGSMQSRNKLPLLQQSLRLAVGQLDARDRVAIVVYAGASGLALPSTPASNPQRILEALDGLEAGGSTNGGRGIQLAYETARRSFIPGGNNRVILATDGDFNVGITNKNELVGLVRKRANDGVFLTVMGFGMGNLKDDRLESLADRGNGNYFYVDSFAEARKVFGQQLTGTLETIAKDVKIQVEFNPSRVHSYRLIGYENRMLAAEDFDDDRKDAGEIGAGHTVTALYQVAPAGLESESGDGGELMTVKLRYKLPAAQQSKRAEFAVRSEGGSFNSASSDFRFASSVAAFGMRLQDPLAEGTPTYAQIAAWARSSRAGDRHGHRAEFVELVSIARSLERGGRSTASVQRSR